jgi:peptide/nickel transport system substrate-binding protein
MENRFGIKDFFIVCLLILVIIMVWLSMVQFDRQYQLVRTIQEQGRDQIRELQGIREALEHGIAVNATTNPSGASLADAFPGIYQLRQDGKYDRGDWLVQNFGAPVGKITPLIAGDLYAYVLQDRVLETLAYQDANTLEWVPLLATSWKITDNTTAWQTYVDERRKQPLTEAEILREPDCPPADKAEDRKSYVASRLAEGRRDKDIGAEPACPPAVIIVFQLRGGVRFTDGSPFTSDDVVFTYDWIMNPKVDAPRDRQALEKIKSVEKVGDYEVVFKFKVPYYQSMAYAATMNVMSNKFYGSYTPEQFNDSVGLLIGTGPYRLPSPTDWKPTTGKIELFRNEQYWGVTPSFDRLVYYQIEQDATNLVMYGNGELDAVGLFPQQYQIVKNRAELMDRSNLKIYSSPLSGYDFIGWNQARNGKPTPFADKRVRQAMTMLTDRDGICKSIFLGFASPAPGPWQASSPAHDPNLQDFKYDPAAAKVLLKEVGIEDRTGTGVLTLPDGKPFTFKITYPTKNETIDRMMQFIKDDYSRAGIDAELDPVDWTVMDQRMKGRDFDAISLGWSGGTVEDDIRQMFHSSQVKDQGDNFVNYISPQFDAALEKAERELDFDKRQQDWHEAERILHDDQPYTFLSNLKSIRLFDKRIKNVELAKTGLNYVSDWVMPMPWYVPAAEQKYK